MSTGDNLIYNILFLGFLVSVPIAAWLAWDYKRDKR